jgi:hypothetical protein
MLGQHGDSALLPLQNSTPLQETDKAGEGDKLVCDSSSSSFPVCASLELTEINDYLEACSQASAKLNRKCM